MANTVQLASPRSRPPATIGELLARENETRDQLTKVATKYLPAERALRLAITAVRRTPRLAQCSPASFMGALISATGLGLEPNTPKQHAFLIPYKARRKNAQGKWEDYWECQFQVGYKGFISLFYRTGIIKAVQAEAVYSGDKFVVRQGTDSHLAYEKNLLVNPETQDLIGAFCYTSLNSGGEVFTVLRASDIYKIRVRSQTYTSLLRNVEEARGAGDTAALARAEKTLAETPWVLWEDQMAAKSAIKRHAKQQDLGTEIAIAADLDNASDVGTIDIEAMADPELAREVLQGGDGEVIPEHAGGVETETAATTTAQAKPGQGQSASTPNQEEQAVAPSNDPARGHFTAKESGGALPGDTSPQREIPSPTGRPRRAAQSMFSE